MVLLGRLEAVPELSGVLSARESGVMGGLIGSSAGELNGVGGLGLGAGSGGTGLGMIGFGSGSRSISEPARAEARRKGSSVAAKCWPADAEGQVTVKMWLSPSGTPEEVRIVGETAPKAVRECILEQVRGWKLPPVEARSPFTLRFRSAE